MFSEICWCSYREKVAPQKRDLGTTDDHVAKIRDLRLLIVDIILIAAPSIN